MSPRSTPKPTDFIIGTAARYLYGLHDDHAMLGYIIRTIRKNGKDAVGILPVINFQGT